MRRRRGQVDGKVTDTSMSSMIDVVFLLLIFFLVVNKPIVEEALFDAALPGGRANPNLRKPKTNVMMVEVKRFGKGRGDDDYYVLNGRFHKLDRLHGLFKKVAENNSETTLLINCGPNAAHEKLVRLLDVCADAGLKSLNVVDDESVLFDKNE